MKKLIRLGPSECTGTILFDYFSHFGLFDFFLSGISPDTAIYAYTYVPATFLTSAQGNLEVTETPGFSDDPPYLSQKARDLRQYPRSST